MTLEEIQERLEKWFKKGVVYNISEGKQFTIKEQPMSNKPTIQDAMNAIGTLTVVVNNLAIEIKDGFEKVNADIASIKKDIVRLDAKIDNIVNLNNLKT